MPGAGLSSGLERLIAQPVWTGGRLIASAWAAPAMRSRTRKKGSRILVILREEAERHYRYPCDGRLRRLRPKTLRPAGSLLRADCRNFGCGRGEATRIPSED